MEQQQGQGAEHLYKPLQNCSRDQPVYLFVPLTADLISCVAAAVFSARGTGKQRVGAGFTSLQTAFAEREGGKAGK